MIVSGGVKGDLVSFHYHAAGMNDTEDSASRPLVNERHPDHKQDQDHQGASSTLFKMIHVNEAATGGNGNRETPCLIQQWRSDPDIHIVVDSFASASHKLW